MAKRRKAETWTRKTVEVTPEMAREFMSQPRLCIWQGCTNVAHGDMPGDWRNILVYWSPWPQAGETLGDIASRPFCSRDAVLCGDHARELESMFKPIGPDPRLEEPAGTA